MSYLKVDAGVGEEATLADYIEWLAHNREAARAIGERAARHIRTEHAPEKVAAAYWEAISTA